MTMEIALMKAVWLSDIHLNFIMKHEREALYRSLHGDVILISGDIAESDSIVRMIAEMHSMVNKPIYFVCGNHDYYGSSITAVRASLPDNWLGNGQHVHLTDRTALVGIDGWADMRHGNSNTYISMNDENYITELRHVRLTAGRLGTIVSRQGLADKDAETLTNAVNTAMSQHTYKQIIVLTHIPPYPEACKHQGYDTDPSVLPYYCSGATGKALDELATQYPNVKFRVFCGHTHSTAYHKPHPNMIVRAGESQYYTPKVQRVLQVY